MTKGSDYLKIVEWSLEDRCCRKPSRPLLWGRHGDDEKSVCRLQARRRNDRNLPRMAGSPWPMSLRDRFKRSKHSSVTRLDSPPASGKHWNLSKRLVTEVIDWGRRCGTLSENCWGCSQWTVESSETGSFKERCEPPASCCRATIQFGKSVGMDYCCPHHETCLTSQSAHGPKHNRSNSYR